MAAIRRTGNGQLDETRARQCAAREVLDRVGDKWSVYVIYLLRDGPHRFTELRRSIDGISQRMLTVTLRNLERDGLVRRTVYPVVPPRVDYTLTRLGRTLLGTVCTLMTWAVKHTGDIDRARAAYDRRNARSDRLAEDSSATTGRSARLERAMSPMSPAGGRGAGDEGQR